MLAFYLMDLRAEVNDFNNTLDKKEVKNFIQNVEYYKKISDI